MGEKEGHTFSPNRDGLEKCAQIRFLAPSQQSGAPAWPCDEADGCHLYRSLQSLRYLADVAGDPWISGKSSLGRSRHRRFFTRTRQRKVFFWTRSHRAYVCRLWV